MMLKTFCLKAPTDALIPAQRSFITSNRIKAT